jgi:hypothetical protein
MTEVERVRKRRRFGGRAARQALTRALCRLIPGLAARIGFYDRALPYDALGAPAHVVEDILPNPLTAEDRRFVAERSRPYENWTDPDYFDPPRLTFRRETFLARGATFVGRSGAVAIESPRALLTPLGGDPDGQRNRAHRVRRRRAVAGVAAPATAFNNIWHLHDELLIPLVAYCESGAAPALSAVLLPASANAFVRTLVGAVAGRYGLRVETAADDEHLTADLALWRETRPCTEWMHLTPEALDALRRALREGLGVPPPGAPRRLHLDRGTGARSLRDRGALDALLARRGIERFTAYAGDLPGQIAAFGAARLVLAAHGAGLVNLIHCPPGACVIEILPVDLPKSTFRMLSRSLGLDYHGVMADRGGFRDPLDVDFAALDALIGSLG